ncbi:hypothetical protein HDU98_010216 [Podochytrium sp. JEL0797]|nr:hypothetical protein HDU98_010216 [Podochytrium sp. JEL0797]
MNPSNRIQVLEAKLASALSEINILRGILSLPLLKEIADPFATQLVPASRLIPTGLRSLQSLPTEVLERIASFLQVRHLFALCHAVPAIKYVSQTVYDVGTRFERRPRETWPDLHILSNPWGHLEMIPSNHLVLVYKYLRFLERFGGVANTTVFTSKTFNSTRPVLANAVDLYLIKGQAKGIIAEICHTVKMLSGGACGNVVMLRVKMETRDEFPCELLEGCADLRELSFSVAHVTSTISAFEALFRSLPQALPKTRVQSVSFSFTSHHQSVLAKRDVVIALGGALVKNGWRVETGGSEEGLCANNGVVWKRGIL